MAQAGRGLRTFAILFGILAVSNLLKPLHLGGEQTGFVFFGHRLSGASNAIIGPLFGVYLAVYAAGLWRRKRYALPMAYAYVAYVVANLVLFSFYGPKPPGMGVGYALFGVVYAAVAIGVAGGAVYALRAQRAELT
jgi:hypothetical protein